MTRSSILSLIAALAGLWMTGCLSTGVMQLAAGPRYRFSRMTEITDAAIVGKEVFVQVSVLRPGRIEPEPVVLKIATDVKFWASSHSVPGGVYMDGVLLAHVPADTLVASGTIPQGGARVPIESIEVTHLRQLEEIDQTPSSGVRVMAIHYQPLEDARIPAWQRGRDVPLPEDPLLAIVGRPIQGQPNITWISDVQDGHTTRRRWLVLMPLAALVDAAVLPFEFIGALVAAE